jgi:hypothetical protein
VETYHRQHEVTADPWCGDVVTLVTVVACAHTHWTVTDTSHLHTDNVCSSHRHTLSGAIVDPPTNTLSGAIVPPTQWGGTCRWVIRGCGL